MIQLILASGSPRRRELMGVFGVPFTVRSADIDETMDPQKPPYEEVARLSLQKALAVPRAPEDVVVAADTVWSARERSWESLRHRSEPWRCSACSPAGSTR